MIPPKPMQEVLVHGQAGLVINKLCPEYLTPLPGEMRSGGGGVFFEWLLRDYSLGSFSG